MFIEDLADKCFKYVYDDDNFCFGVITYNEQQVELLNKEKQLLDLLQNINVNFYQCDYIMFILEKMFMANHIYKKITTYPEKFIHLIKLLFNKDNPTVNIEEELIKSYRFHNLTHLQNIFWKTNKLDPNHKYNYKFYLYKCKPNKIKHLLEIDQKSNTHQYENYLLNWFYENTTKYILPKNHKKAIKILNLILKYNKIEKDQIQYYYNLFIKNSNNTEFDNNINQIFVIYL